MSREPMSAATSRQSAPPDTYLCQRMFSVLSANVTLGGEGSTVQESSGTCAEQPAVESNCSPLRAQKHVPTGLTTGQHNEKSWWEGGAGRAGQEQQRGCRHSASASAIAGAGAEKESMRVRWEGTQILKPNTTRQAKQSDGPANRAARHAPTTTLAPTAPVHVLPAPTSSPSFSDTSLVIYLPLGSLSFASSTPTAMASPASLLASQMLVIVAILAQSPSTVFGNSSGAPQSSCSSGNVGHGNYQTGNGGYALSFDPELESQEFQPGQQYTVTLSGPQAISGFLLWRTPARGALSTVGTNTKNTCSGNGITHNKLLSASSIQFRWTAPTENSVTFRSTVLTGGRFGNYWIFETASLTVDCAADLHRHECETTTTQNTCGVCLDGYFDPTGDQNAYSNTLACQQRDWSRASSLVTPDCDENCPMEARWVLDGDDVNFQITIRGASNAEWAAIGFSRTRFMAQTDIISAHMRSMGDVTVINRWASGYSSPSQDPDQSGFSEVSGMRTSNILQFQFSRQLAPINPNDVDFRNQSDVREFIMLVVHPIPNTRNMKKYYVMVAFGSGFFNKHPSSSSSSGPIVSASQIALQQSGRISAVNPSRARAATIAHGIVMVLAWILISPTAISIAHNLKFIGQQWFVAHKYLQILSALLIFIGVIIIFADVGESRGGTHQSLGVAVFILLLVQILLGFARDYISGKPIDPEKEKHGPRRMIFNYVHWTLGALLTAMSDIMGTRSNAKTGKFEELSTIDEETAITCFVNGYVSPCISINFLEVYRQNLQLGSTVAFAVFSAAVAIALIVYIRETPN
eukprot:gene4160-6512_t